LNGFVTRLLDTVREREMANLKMLVKTLESDEEEPASSSPSSHENPTMFAFSDLWDVAEKSDYVRKKRIPEKKDPEKLIECRKQFTRDLRRFVDAGLISKRKSAGSGVGESFGGRGGLGSPDAAKPKKGRRRELLYDVSPLLTRCEGIIAGEKGELLLKALPIWLRRNCCFRTKDGHLLFCPEWVRRPGSLIHLVDATFEDFDSGDGDPIVVVAFARPRRTLSRGSSMSPRASSS